jgi:uncharacterized protein YvpB
MNRRSGLGALLVAAGLAGCMPGRGHAPEPASEAAPRRVHLRVAGRPQAQSLSCESRSACDLLGFHGLPGDESRFLAGLPRSDDPDLGFVGDPDGPGGGLPPASYGVHAAPVAQRLREHGLAAEATRGRDLPWLRAEIAAGRPVVVWATADLAARTPVTLSSRAGRRFLAVAGEHTFLVTGFGPGTVVLLDPASGREKHVAERRFDEAWATLGRIAVSARAPDSSALAAGDRVE